jgi:hypothetical protein
MAQNRIAGSTDAGRSSVTGWQTGKYHDIGEDTLKAKR